MNYHKTTKLIAVCKSFNTYKTNSVLNVSLITETYWQFLILTVNWPPNVIFLYEQLDEISIWHVDIVTSYFTLNCNRESLLTYRCWKERFTFVTGNVFDIKRKQENRYPEAFQIKWDLLHASWLVNNIYVSVSNL